MAPIRVRFGLLAFWAFQPFKPKANWAGVLHRLRVAALARRQYLLSYRNPLDFRGGEILHALKRTWLRQRSGKFGRDSHSSQLRPDSPSKFPYGEHYKFWDEVWANRVKSVAARKGFRSRFVDNAGDGFVQSAARDKIRPGPRRGFWQIFQPGRNTTQEAFDVRFGGPAWTNHDHTRFSSPFSSMRGHSFGRGARQNPGLRFHWLFRARRRAAYRRHLREHRDPYFCKGRETFKNARPGLWHMHDKCHRCAGERTKYLGTVKSLQSDPSGGSSGSVDANEAILVPVISTIHVGRTGAKIPRGHLSMAMVQSLKESVDKSLIRVGSRTRQCFVRQTNCRMVRALRRRSPLGIRRTGRLQNDLLRHPLNAGSLSAFDIGPALLEMPRMQASLAAPLHALIGYCHLPKGPLLPSDTLRAFARALMSLVTPLTVLGSRWSLAALLVLVPLLLAAGNTYTALEEAPFTGRKRVVALTAGEREAIEVRIAPPVGAGAEARRRHWIKVLGELTGQEPSHDGKLMGCDVIGADDWRTWWVEGVLNMVVDSVAGEAEESGRFDVLVLEKDERNAFSLGCAKEGVIVVYSGILDAIMNASPPPSLQPSPPSSVHSEVTASSSSSYRTALPSTSQTHSLALLLSHELAHLVLSHPLESHSRYKAQELWWGLLGDAIVATAWPVVWLAGPWGGKEALEGLGSEVAAWAGRSRRWPMGCECSGRGKGEEDWWTRTEEMEKEADEVALRLMTAAGFEPRLAAVGWGLEHSRFHGVVGECDDSIEPFGLF